MKHQNISKTFVFVLVACSMFFMASSQAQVTYTLTGRVDTVSFSPTRPVLNGETYTAVFEVDDTVADSDPSSGRGEYSGAITSSSITFSGGYISSNDFSGGDVVVRQDSSGHGLFLSTPEDSSSSLSGTFLVYSLDQFSDDIDALITSPQEVNALSGSLWFLFEPGFSISVFVSPDSPSAQTLRVTSAAPEVLLGDVNLDGARNFLDIGPFIDVLRSGEYMAEADVNGDGSTNFGDISTFISLLFPASTT